MLSIARENIGRNHIEGEYGQWILDTLTIRYLRSEQVELFSSKMTNLFQFAGAFPSFSTESLHSGNPFIPGQIGMVDHS